MMNNAIMQRLKELEQRTSYSVPNYEQFKAEWSTMDELSRALFIFCAEQPQTWDSTERRYMQAIREHLDTMGLIDHDAKSITELAGELDTVGGGADYA